MLTFPPPNPLAVRLPNDLWPVCQKAARRRDMHPEDTGGNRPSNCRYVPSLSRLITSTELMAGHRQVELERPVRPHAGR